MEETKKSSSEEQVLAEEFLFKKIQEYLGINLQKNLKIYLKDNAYTYTQPDFFSEEYAIVGQIYAHIGKNKTGQKGKISNDILKMLLLEKMHNKPYRKILVVCDQEQKKYLEGNSLLAESVYQFGIEVQCFELDEELYVKVEKAQKRQIMINA